MTARIFALCNQKGGVGKSTTTFHLARAAVRRGRRVLVVDLDPQGNLTTLIAGEEVEQDQAGTADVLSARSPYGVRDVAIPGAWDGLSLVPTTGDSLGAVRDELVVSGPGREARLSEALAVVAEDYDLILIDCAPALDQLTSNALTAAHGVVVVTHTRLLSSNGLGSLLQTIESVRGYYNQNLYVAGIIVNMHDPQTVSGRERLEELRAAAAESNLHILEPVVDKRVVIGDAADASIGLDEWGSKEATALGEMYAKHLTSIEEHA